jgi:hypothetical protein
MKGRPAFRASPAPADAKSWTPFIRFLAAYATTFSQLNKDSQAVTAQPWVAAAQPQTQ